MKEKILHTAAEMFIQFGFKSITMDDIAQKMAISKKTIYSHFANKTALVEETTLTVFTRICAGIDQIIAQKHNPIEEMLAIKNFVMENLNNEQSSPHFQLMKYYPQIFEKLQTKQLEVMHDCVEDNIKRGMEAGLYRKDLNTEFIVRMYFAGGSSVKNDNLFPQELFKKSELMAWYLDYHLHAIATAKGKKLIETLTPNKK